MNKFTCFVLCVLAASPAYSSDIGASLKKPFDEEFTSNRNLFDLERCLIQADGPGLPSVFKQADRPGEMLIGYSAGVGIPILLKLTTLDKGTRIEVRRRRLLMKKSGIPDSIRECFADQ